MVALIPVMAIVGLGAFLSGCLFPEPPSPPTDGDGGLTPLTPEDTGPSTPRQACLNPQQGRSLELEFRGVNTSDAGVSRYVTRLLLDRPFQWMGNGFSGRLTWNNLDPACLDSMRNSICPSFVRIGTRVSGEPLGRILTNDPAMDAGGVRSWGSILSSSTGDGGNFFDGVTTYLGVDGSVTGDCIISLTIGALSRTTSGRDAGDTEGGVVSRIQPWAVLIYPSVPTSDLGTERPFVFRGPLSLNASSSGATVFCRGGDCQPYAGFQVGEISARIVLESSRIVDAGLTDASRDVRTDVTADALSDSPDASVADVSEADALSDVSSDSVVDSGLVADASSSDDATPSTD